MRDHHDRRLRGQAIINGPKHERLCAAARLASAGHVLCLHIGKRQNKVQRANGIPGLQPHLADTPKLMGRIGGKMAVRVLARFG